MTDRDFNTSVTDVEIIRLYENGLSQQEIHRLHGCNIKRIRAVLQNAGYNTAIYRRTPMEFEDVIHVLLRAGVSYRAIAEVSDISYHVIREIADRRENKMIKKVPIRKRDAKSEREAIFLHHYLSGQSFCLLSASMGLTKNEIIKCYALIDDDSIRAHREALRTRIYAEDACQNTISSLARKYGVSASTIKAHLNI